MITVEAREPETIGNKSGAAGTDGAGVVAELRANGE